MANAFDPSQPGARRLLEMARQLRQPGFERVEILAPLVAADEHRPLHRGDHVALPAGLARMLVDNGLARAAE